jgi:Zn-dependent protease
MDSVIFQIAILIMSVVVHEVSHGYAALWLGDETAQNEGRLTLNPIKHLDPFGSVLLPLLLSLVPGGIIFGWAKPVPYNPYNLKNRRWGEAIVAAAGPISNLVIALVFGMFIRFAMMQGLSQDIIEISLIIVATNVLLAIFNLVPIPPLDGSKIFFAILPEKYVKFRETIERAGFFLVLIFVFVLWQFLFPLVELLIGLFTGINF